MSLDHVAAKAESFESALASMVGTVEAALIEYEREPHPGFDYARSKWRDTALRRLAADLQETRSHLPQLANPESLKTMLRLAENETGLAKNLDTFRYDFAGASFDEALRTEVKRTVLAASDLVRAIASLE